MSKEQAQEALRKMNNIIDQWTDMRMDANDACELLLPLLKTVTSYFDLDPAAESSSDLNLEKAEDLETPEAEEDEAKEKMLQEDLFSKEESEDLELNDESKSKSKKKSKEFAGSNGEIPF